MSATEEQIKRYLRGRAPDEGVLEPVWSVGPIFPPFLIEVLLGEEELADSLEKEADDVNEQEEREIQECILGHET